MQEAQVSVSECESIARRHPALTYFLLTFGISWTGAPQLLTRSQKRGVKVRNERCWICDRDRPNEFAYATLFFEQYRDSHPYSRNTSPDGELGCRIFWQIVASTA